MKRFARTLGALLLAAIPAPLAAQPVIDQVSPADGAVLSATEVVLSGTAQSADTVTVNALAATLVGDSWSIGPLALGAQGNNVFTIDATDAVGTSQLVVTLVRDTVAPTVTVSSPGEGALRSSSTVDVSGTASDAHLSSVTVNGTPASLSAGTFLASGVPLAEGPNALVVRAEDTAGNSFEVIRTVVRDQTPPALAITDPAPGTVVPEATITLSGTVTDVHLDRVTVDGLPATITGSTWSRSMPLQEGVNVFAVVAIDLLGNTSSASVTVVRDSQAPSIVIDQPDEGLATQAAEVAVSGTVDDEVGVTVSVNGIDASIASGTFTVVAVPLASGENALVARATDAQGNQGSHTRTIVRDNDPPALALAEPASGALSIEPSTVFRLTFDEVLALPGAGAWSLETTAGVAVAAVIEHEGAMLRIVPDAPLAGSTDLVLDLGTGLADLAGNAFVGTSLAFRTADGEAPSAPVLDPLPGYLCAPSLAVAGTAEAGTLVEARGGAAVATVRADDVDGSFTLTVDLLPERLNLLSVTATDTAGNISSPATLSVVQDCEPPSVLSAVRGTASDTVEVRFDEPMNEASVVSALSVSDASGALAGSTILDTGGTVATFTSTATLPVGELLADVSIVAMDLAGNALAFPFASQVSDGATTSFLAGTVIDDATGRPLAGAQVTVTATDGVALADPLPTQTTTTDGRFLLAVDAGSHDLSVGKAGYTPVFRIVAAAVDTGTDVFDPRLTPVAVSATVGSAGAMLIGEDGAILDLPAGALAVDTAVSLTAISEQGLAALLPFGWSPRGGVWVDLDAAPLAVPATVTVPVDAPDGTTLAVVRLDLATLQWWVEAEATVIGSAVSRAVSATTALAAVAADTGPLAPPPAVVGQTLGAGPLGAGTVVAASVTFDPTTVLATETSEATVTYTVTPDVASGLPLTLRVDEDLELLDGSTRMTAPYEADLVLFHDSVGVARSRFRLQPSASARMLPLDMGLEDVTVAPYAGGAVAGDVIGPEGGSAIDAEGDRVDLPAGALAAPTAVAIERRATTDLPLGTPRNTVIDGVVALDFGGATLQAPASLSLVLDPPPTGTEDGVLIQVIDLDGVPAYRPVARIVPTATGWSTVAIDALDLPWPGVRSGGLYAFARFTAPHGFLRGTALDVAGMPIAGAVISSTAVDWLQLSDVSGAYVLPLPVGTATIDVLDPVTGNQVAVSVTVTVGDERIDLDPTVTPSLPSVVEVSPADGATGVIAGIEPTVRFSEPIDPATAGAAIGLFDDTDSVAITLTVTGDLVRLVPLASLVPGRTYGVAVNRDLRDLQGNALDAPFEATFTVAGSTLPTGVDPGRVFLIEPDVAGTARVRGLSGAVPSLTLVFAENTSSSTATESVNALTDGSFELTIEAAIGDRLLLHILIPGANEALLVLEVFMAADLRTGIVGNEAVSFSTVDGIGVALEAGTFPASTRVVVTPTSAVGAPLDTPATMTGLYGFTLDFGGAQAEQPIALSLPLASLAVQPGPGDGLILASSAEALGQRWWLLDDLMRIEGDMVTNRPQTGTSGALRVPEAQNLVRGSLERVPGAKAGAGTSSDPVGIVRAATYRLMAVPDMRLIVVPAIQAAFGVFNLSNDFAGLVAAGVSPALQPAFFFLPTSLGQQAILEGWDLGAGTLLFEDVIDAPTDPTVVLPTSIFQETTPPYPVSGSPGGWHAFSVSSLPLTLAPGLTATASGSSITVAAAAGALASGTELRVHAGSPVSAVASGRASASGDVSLSVLSHPDARYVVTVGSEIAPGGAVEVRFNETVQVPAGFVLRRGGASVPVEVTQPGTGEIVQVRPRDGWRTGTPYRFEMTAAVLDASGNPLLGGQGVSLEVNVRPSRTLDTLGLAPVRDTARLGSLLFVAAGQQGLAIVDASDPANLEQFLPTLPLPLGDEVRGVEVDGHGRVIYVGGGVSNFGVLRMIDVQTLDPAVLQPATNPTWREQVVAGLSIVSDPFDQDIHPDLASGKPIDITVLNDDDTVTWIVGQPAPAGVTVDATTLPVGRATSILAVSGSDGTPGLPVTLRNLSRGSFRREDAALDGTFTVALAVRLGDRITLVKNRKSFAYVALEGDVFTQASLVVVDLAQVYRRELDDPGPAAAVLANIAAQDFRITQTQASTAFCSATTVSEAADFRQVAVIERVTPAGMERTFFGLARSFGLVLLDVPEGDLTDLTLFLDGECGEVDGQKRMTGMAVAERYPVLVPDGVGGEREEIRDFVVMGNEVGMLLVVDTTDRNDVRLVSRIRLPGPIGRLALDRGGRRLIVAGRGAGLYMVDFRRLSLDPVDMDGDSRDDRVLETIAIGADNLEAPPLLVPELGLVFAGGLSEGLSSIAVGGPDVRLVVDEAGAPREALRLAPFGVPTGPETTAPGAPDRQGTVRVMARLPGHLGGAAGQIEIDLLGTSPEGATVQGAGAVPVAVADRLPRTAYEGAFDALTLERAADQPWHEGYDVFVSDPIVLLADLRASVHVDMTQKEKDEPGLCTRCDLVNEGVYATPAEAAASPFRELLSGSFVTVRLGDNLRLQLADTYDGAVLDEAQPVVESVPWDLSPTRLQEPVQNPSFGSGDVAPGTLLHSGEMTITDAEAVIRSRGFSFALTRTYRNQGLGNGPFGPGWDHVYHQRLRPLPNGSVEYFDGRGRRETFISDNPGGFVAPVGRFFTLARLASGFELTDAGRNRLRFDSFGRLTSIRDAVYTGPETGNEMRFAYGPKGELETITDTLGRDISLDYNVEGHIVAVTDFTGRVFAYAYGAEGRLETVTTPAVETVPDGGGVATTAGLVTRYTYENAAGDLSASLRSRDNVVACHDAKHTTPWLTLTWGDRDGDGMAEEVIGQRWGDLGDDVAIAYPSFGSSIAVTDRRGNVCTYQVNGTGQTTQLTDPSAAVWTWSHNADGLVTESTLPLGRRTTYVYEDAEGLRRSHGNVGAVTVTPDIRGANGSDAMLVATYAYEEETNQRVMLTDARSAVTTTLRQARTGLATEVRQPENVTSMIEYNAFGQPTTITNPNQNITEHAYFTSGASTGYLRETIVGTNGTPTLRLTTTYETDARGNVTAVIDPRRVKHTTSYNVLDWPTASVAASSASSDGAPPLGYTTTYDYDPNGNLVALHLPFDQGTITTEVRRKYDILDALVEASREIDSGVFATTALTRDKNRNVATVTDPENNRIETDYDPRNLPITRRSNLGNDQLGLPIVESMTWNPDREQTLHTDGRGKLWPTDYDGYGRVRETSDPIGNSDHLSYNNAGNVTCTMATAPGEVLLAATTMRHDFLGRPTHTRQHLWQYDQVSPAASCPTQPIGRDDFPAFAGTTPLTTQMLFDAASNLIEQIDAEGRHTFFSFDQAERLVERTDPLLNKQTYVLDPNGNALSFISTEFGDGGPATVTTTASFDTLNRPRESRDGLNNLTKTTFDARNQLRLVVDPENFTQTYAFDGLDRKTFEVKEPGISVSYGWDKSSRLRTYTDALGNVSQWGFDAANRRITQILPGGDTWTSVYDESHNLIELTDPNGSVITDTHDPANRLTARAVVRGTGVVGTTAESYAWDGLDHLAQAVSGAGTGAVTTDQVWDAASRMLSETTLGRAVGYGYDQVHNRVATTYPSGHQVNVTVDPLDRPDVVSIAGVPQPAVDYGYRGPWLRSKSTLGNGLEGTWSFDDTWRPTASTVSVPSGPSRFEEKIAWNKRSLKSAVERTDSVTLGGIYEHDAAHRLSALAMVPNAMSAVTANGPTPTVDALAERRIAFTHDQAQNLLSRTEVRDEALSVSADFPVDASGRNRPASAAGQPFTYDPNGNRTKAADGKTYHFDYRNRLSEVRDAGGTLIATYTYDAFNRRVRKDVVGQPVEETVYAAWQELETYAGGLLAQRRTFGAGLDEIVRLEDDTNSDGLIDTTFTPIFDHTGNLALLTLDDQRVAARYDFFDPYGESLEGAPLRLLTDLAPPVVQQLRYEVGQSALDIELDEPVRGDLASATIDVLSQPTQSLAHSISQPVRTGPMAGRRLVVTVDSPPADGTLVRLTVPAASIVDRFGNEMATDLVADFTWDSTLTAPQVLLDTALPEVQQVRIAPDRHLEITFSEPPTATAGSAVTVTEVVPGQSLALTYTVQGDDYTLRSDTLLTGSSFTLSIDPVISITLSAETLSAPFDIAFDLPAQLTSALIAYERPDPAEAPIDTYANRYAFHGRPIDLETGLVYFRNRYFDPGTGRFVSADPLGYTDGPSTYQGFGSSPLNKGDPLGLAIYAFDGTWQDQDRMENDSNVAILRDLYIQPVVGDADGTSQKFYQRGVGTTPRSKYFGGFTGYGSRKRVKRAYAQLVENFEAGDEEIVIVGFSRGAAAAREFANLVNEKGVRLSDGTVKRPTIRFLGLFDTVASMGWPGNRIDLTYSMSIPPNVEQVRQAVAADERRYFFPLWSICPRSGCASSNRVEQSFRGSHADIGGGYQDDDSAAKHALYWMWLEARALGIPFDDLQPEYVPGVWGPGHDSKKKHQPVYYPETLDQRNTKRGQRRVFYPRQ